jgi:hypothetical protein
MLVFYVIFFTLFKVKLSELDEANANLKDRNISLDSLIYDLLINNRISNLSMKNVFYLVIIAGYSSELNDENQYTEYERSYKKSI